MSNGKGNRDAVNIGIDFGPGWGYTSMIWRSAPRQFMPLTLAEWPPEPRLETQEQWDEANRAPSALQLHNRICEIEEAISYYHNRGDDAPLQWYDELEHRTDQRRALPEYHQ